MGSITTSSRSLLDALEDICNVDVDSVDPQVAQSLPFKAHNQTSNQAICSNAMLAPENADLFARKVRDYGALGWEEVFNQVTVQLCANNLENFTGRVLAQVSPRHVFDKEAVLKQAHAYDRAFASHGIGRDRYALKISTTGPAMAAAKQLTEEGVSTLGTSLFGLPQAIAASQAGCLYISPYFNEVAAYSDSSLIHKGVDPALTHHMAPRVIHILETYAQMYVETGKEQPLIVMASNANINEVLATAELGCQHITILAPHLAELAVTPLDDKTLARYPFLARPPAKKHAPYYAKYATPPRFASHSSTDPLAASNWDGKFADWRTDYLADNGNALTEAIASDAAMTRKLRDVLDAFLEADEKAKVAIEKAWADLEVDT